MCSGSSAGRVGSPNGSRACQPTVHMPNEKWSVVMWSPLKVGLSATVVAVGVNHLGSHRVVGVRSDTVSFDDAVE